MQKGFRANPEKIPVDYDIFRNDPILSQGIGDPIKRVYSENLAVREETGALRGWFPDAWFAEEQDLRNEAVEIIESIRSRI